MAQRIPSILILEAELQDRGGYLLILRLASEERLKVGGLGKIDFNRGYYVYVGSSDCSCPSRLYVFETHPLNLAPSRQSLQKRPPDLPSVGDLVGRCFNEPCKYF